MGAATFSNPEHYETQWCPIIKRLTATLLVKAIWKKKAINSILVIYGKFKYTQGIIEVIEVFKNFLVLYRA